MKRKQSFTLVELMVVIAIIAILAGMIFAALGGASGKAENAKVKAEIKNVQTAIAAFQLEYNKLPKPKDYDGKALDDDQLKWLFKVLKAVNEKDLPDGEKEEVKKLYDKYGNPNTKKKKFYDGSERDYWDNLYQVAFEKNYGKGIAPKVSSEYVVAGLYSEDESKNFDFDVIVWSKGSDNKQSKTITDASNEDNIYSIDVQWIEEKGHVIQK